MLFEIIIKYSMLFVAFSVIASLLFRAVLMLLKYIRSRYIKRQKRRGRYALEDDEIPHERHNQQYAKLKEKMLEKQQEKYEEMRRASSQMTSVDENLEDKEARIVAFAEPQGKWTKLFIDQLKTKFLSRQGKAIKSKWTLLVSLYGRSQGKYKGRYK